ncbi:MAG: sensor histidine kinase [Eisenbergiella massiliensis]
MDWKTDRARGMLWIQGKNRQEPDFPLPTTAGSDEEAAPCRPLENKELLDQERRARKRIGLVNIQSRLKLMYGDAGGLTFGRKEGMTIVTVKLPIDIQEGR